MWSKNYETPAPQNAYIQPFYSTLSVQCKKEETYVQLQNGLNISLGKTWGFIGRK
jgi:hypothetical protein